MYKVVIMKSNGYTIPELLVVIIIMGILATIVINKASYAFTDPNEESKKTEEMILIKSATAYGKSILESLKIEDKYISGRDLIDSEYLIDTDNQYNDVKIKLSYNVEEDNVSVEILK